MLAVFDCVVGQLLCLNDAEVREVSLPLYISFDDHLHFHRITNYGATREDFCRTSFILCR